MKPIFAQPEHRTLRSTLRGDVVCCAMFYGNTRALPI